MIFWTRLGFLVLLITGGCILLGYTVLSLFGIDTDVQNIKQVVAGAAFLLSAAINFAFFKYYLDQREQPRHMVDSKTGQQVIIHHRSTFMFLPYKYWPYVLAATGAVLIGSGLFAR